MDPAGDAPFARHPPVRLFYSYAGQDEELRRQLETHLANLRHQGLVDEWHSALVQAGQERKAEVTRQLAQAEVILLLISADFLASPACYHDELLAALSRHERRSARAVPILLRPTEMVGAPFAKLQRLPHNGEALTAWKDRDEAWVSVVNDLRLVIEELMASPDRLPPGSDDVSSASPAGDQAPRPLLPAGPPVPGKLTLRPPQAPYDGAWYVHRDIEERRALGRLEHPGAPVVLQGPSQSGKDTLLNYLLDQWRGKGPAARVARVSLHDMDATAFQSLDLLLRALAEKVLDGLHVPKADALVARAWQRPGAEKTKLNWLMAKHILHTDAPLLLCVERTERVQDCSFRHEFFALLRSWAENQAVPFTALRLLVTLSVEPTLLETTDSSAFFALSAPIRLRDLDRQQVAALSALHGLPAAEADLDALWQLLSGHPYLTRLALYEAVLQGQPLKALLASAAQDSGIFADHLIGLWGWLSKNRLADAVRGVLRDPRFALSVDDYYKLYSKGLVVKEDGGTCRLRCKLYQDYFQRL